jgi:hypothetical protein
LEVDADGRCTSAPPRASIHPSRHVLHNAHIAPTPRPPLSIVHAAASVGCVTPRVIGEERKKKKEKKS